MSGHDAQWQVAAVAGGGGRWRRRLAAAAARRGFSRLSRTRATSSSRPASSRSAAALAFSRLQPREQLLGALRAQLALLQPVLELLDPLLQLFALRLHRRRRRIVTAKPSHRPAVGTDGTGQLREQSPTLHAARACVRQLRQRADAA
jgi:hypothetical protein